MATNETVDIDLNVKTNLPGTLADLRQMKKELKTIKDDDAFREKKKEIDDLEDALKSAKTGAGNFAEVLGTIPGPLGQIGGQIGGTLQSLKQFGALKFADIKSSFVELGKDVVDAGKGLLKLTGITKVYEVTTAATSKVLQFFGISLNASNTAAKALGATLATLTAATGLIAIVALIDLVSNAWDNYTHEAENADAAQKKLNETIQKGNKAALDAETAFVKRQGDLLVAQAKAKGANANEIFKIEQQNRELLVASQQRYYNDIKDKDSDEARAALITLKDTKNSILVAEANFQAQKLEKSDAANKIQLEKDKQNLLTITKNAKEATNSLLTEREQQRQKITDDYATKIELAKKYGKDTYVLEEAQKKAQADLTEKFRKEDSAKDREKKFEDIQALVDDLDYQNQLIEGDYAEDQQRLANKGAYLAEQKKIELDNTELTEAERIKIIAKYAKLEKEVDKDLTISKKAELAARQQAQLQFLDAIGNLFGALSGLFEQGTAASKAFALAEIGIGVAKGFINGLTIAQEGAKAAGPAAPFAFPTFYATQIAAVLTAAAKARQILSTPKSGASAGGAGTTATQPPLAAYGGALKLATPQITGTEAATPGSQIAQTIAMSSGKPVRAYVVSGDITNQQALDRKTSRGATFGLG